MNEQVRNADSQPGTSGTRNLTRANSRSPTKQLKWDRAVLETLVRFLIWIFQGVKSMEKTRLH